MRKNIDKFFDNKGKMMAMLIPNNYSSLGIDFLTDNNAFQQVAFMNHNKGHIIKAHIHNKIARTIDYTTETLVMKKGILLVELYDEKKMIYSFKIKKGDILTLYSGGHGFKVLKKVKMVEIKQGPFLGAIDKERF